MKFNTTLRYFGDIWRKNTKCWETLRELSKLFKKSLQNSVKMLILAYFSKDLTNSCVHLSLFEKNANCWENFEKILKIFDENSIEKLNFLMIFVTFVTKNRAFGISTIFLQQFSRLRGWGISPLPPRKSASE